MITGILVGATFITLVNLLTAAVSWQAAKGKHNGYKKTQVGGEKNG